MEAAVKAGVKSGGGAALPGMIFNQGKKVAYTDVVSEEDKSVYAGRLECTMQVSGRQHSVCCGACSQSPAVLYSTLLTISPLAQHSTANDAKQRPKFQFVSNSCLKVV